MRAPAILVAPTLMPLCNFWVKVSSHWRGKTYFDHAIVHAHGIVGHCIGGRTMNGSAISQGKDRIVPGTLDTAVVVEFTLLQWPAGMGTNRANRLDLITLPIEQNGLAGYINTARLALA